MTGAGSDPDRNHPSMTCQVEVVGECRVQSLGVDRGAGLQGGRVACLISVGVVLLGVDGVHA